MELKKIVLQNKGMSRDLSISKEIQTDGSQEYSYENHNIRIQALDDGTYLSVTNIRGPKHVKTTVETEIKGTVVGKCFCEDYLVLFTHGKGNKDSIYRIHFIDEKGQLPAYCLYTGDLGFTLDNYIDTIFYKENKNIQKVYFVDGKNYPRVINIITPSEIAGGRFQAYTSNCFEFYPTINKLPRILVKKDYGRASQLPSGVIQYFISYYTRNGAETLIANATSVFTIDYLDRGAPADAVGSCGFNIKISNLDKSFDFVRIYSAVRTSQEGRLSVKIVGDYSIPAKGDKIEIYDGGINQETIEDKQLFFIGGNPFIASTLVNKHNTLFFGNIQSEPINISEENEKRIQKCTIKYSAEYGDTEKNKHYWSTAIKFTQDKTVNNIISETKISEFKRHLDTKKSNNYHDFTILPNLFNSNYPYRLQTANSSLSYKTFKRGEVYRFGIQFQTERGTWTDVIWIGDKKCDIRPKYDEDTHTFFLNNATFTMPKEIKKLCKEIGYKNYRICIADPELCNGRTIFAQGIVNPTMFTPGQRAVNAPYTLSSWLMRPRNGIVANRHFEPIQAAEESSGAELYSYQLWENYGASSNSANTKPWEDGEYTQPYVFPTNTYIEKTLKHDKPGYLVTFLSLGSRQAFVKTVKVWGDADINFRDVKYQSDDYEEVFSGWYDEATYSKAKKEVVNKLYNDMASAFKSHGINATYIPSKATIKAVMKQVHQGKIDILKAVFMFVAAIALAAAAIILAVTSWGTSAGLSALMIWEAIQICAVASGTLIAGGIQSSINAADTLKNMYGLSEETQKNLINTLKDCPNWQKELLCRGYYAYSKGDDIKDTFVKSWETWKPSRNPEKLEGFDASIFMPPIEKHINSATVNLISVLPLPVVSAEDMLKKKQFNEYYIDESTVSFHCPEIESLGLDGKKYQFRIVGVAPIKNVYADADVLVENPYSEFETLQHANIVKNYREGTELLTGDYLWYGSGFYLDKANGEITEQRTNALVKNLPAEYKVFLWHRSGSILGADGDTLKFTSDTDGTGDEKFEILPSLLKDKTIFNHSFSPNTSYFSSKHFVNYSPGNIKLFAKEGNDGINYRQGNKYRFYYGNYDNLITEVKEYEKSGKKNKNKLFYGLKNFSRDELEREYYSPFTLGTVRIKYKSTNHLVFDLDDTLNIAERKLLPVFEDEQTFQGVKTRKSWLGDIWAGGHDSNFTIDCWTTNEETFHEDVFFIYAKDYIWIGEVEPKEKGKNKNARTGRTKKYNLTKYDSFTSVVETVNKTDIFYGDKLRTPDTLNLCDGTKLAYLLTQELSLTEKFIAMSFIKRKRPIVIAMPKKTTLKGNRFTKIKITDVKLKNGKFYDVVCKEFRNDSQIYLIKNQLGNRYTFSNSSGLKLYKNFPIKYKSPVINMASISSEYPYVFIGELYKPVEYKHLYNGITNNKNLVWLPASSVTPINEDVKQMEGDTYYQRWDCLKTYPAGEEDFENKVVDITSCMIESHVNLDARTDTNRAAYNLLSRPSNFDVYNTVYNFKNNIFSFSTNDTLANNLYPSQFVWSLTKNYLADVDSWTNTNLVGLGQCKYPITKLALFNDRILALTTHSLETISFNDRQLTTTGDTTVEINNSEKMNGTTDTISSNGSHNKSIQITDRGVYYIDDNEKSLIRVGGEGVQKVGILRVSSWLKQNIKKGTYTPSFTEPFHLEYDSINKDLYLISGKTAIVYNEILDAFTSIVDMEETNYIVNYDNEIYAVATAGQNQYPAQVFKLFSGERYNMKYKDVLIDYELHYRVNPNPFTDKVFTNVEFIADLSFANLGVPTDNRSKYSPPLLPFNYIQAWNEYQDTGKQTLTFNRHNPSNLKQKFRIWRADIPRNRQGKFTLGGDRIRNPWIHLVLGKHNTNMYKDVLKLELHNLVVQYME